MIELDVTKSHVLHQWKADSALIACRFSPTGDHCVSTSQDNRLQRWNIADGQKVVLEGHESWVHALTFNKTGDQLISGGCEGRLIWWSILEAQPKAIRSVEAHAGWIRGVEISPDGDCFDKSMPAFLRAFSFSFPITISALLEGTK
jgi:WD40 repeat protein